MADRIRYELVGDVLQPLLPGARALGDRVMAKKAAGHLAVLGKQLIVADDPATVGDLVASVLRTDARFRSVPAGGAEAAAWAAESMFGSFPRLAVWSSGNADFPATFGVERFVWRLRFPQGSGFVARAWEPIVQALANAGTRCSEEAAVFGFAGGQGAPDGEWRVVTP